MPVGPPQVDLVEVVHPGGLIGWRKAARKQGRQHLGEALDRKMQPPGCLLWRDVGGIHAEADLRGVGRRGVLVIFTHHP